MTVHFTQLKLGNKTYKQKVSTEGCTDVDDFKGAIKNRFSPDLDPYVPYQLTLFQPDGITEIDPGETIATLNNLDTVGPWTPLVVTVPTTTPTGSSKKQLVYKGMTTEASCRKYFDALAIAFFIEYDFPKKYGKPTMGDVLAAYRGEQGKREQTSPGVTWWDYRRNDGLPLTNEPLPSRLSTKQWKTLERLNRKTSDRIHDALLPQTSNRKPFIVLPHDDFLDIETVSDLKSIAASIGLVPTEADLIVKDELDLATSSGCESGRPGKESQNVTRLANKFDA